MSPRVKCDELQIIHLVESGFTNEQIAAKIGVTARTLSRWRGAHPALNAEINKLRERRRKSALLGHGTHACYVRGCRCAECRSAANERRRRVRQSMYAQGLSATDPRHGSSSTYVNWGCRCGSCKAAWAVECHRRHESRKRRLTEDPSIVPHGHLSTYTGWGCRCGDCCAAVAIYYRQRRGVR